MLGLKLSHVIKRGYWRFAHRLTHLALKIRQNSSSVISVSLPNRLEILHSAPKWYCPVICKTSKRTEKCEMGNEISWDLVLRWVSGGYPIWQLTPGCPVLNESLTHWGLDRMTAICKRWHFQIYFLEWTLSYCDWSFNEFRSWGSNWQ